MKNLHISISDRALSSLRQSDPTLLLVLPEEVEANSGVAKPDRTSPFGGGLMVQTIYVKWMNLKKVPAFLLEQKPILRDVPVHTTIKFKDGSWLDIFVDGEPNMNEICPVYIFRGGKELTEEQFHQLLTEKQRAFIWSAIVKKYNKFLRKT